jgi:hypothetical protein
VQDDDERQPPHVEHTAPPADDDMGYGVSFTPDQDDDAIDAGGDRPRRHRRRRRRSG